MNEKQLFKALSEVDEKYIDETEKTVTRHFFARRGWVVAACLVLLLAISVGSVALSDGIVWFVDTSSTTWEDGTIEFGYDLEAKLEEMPASEIKGNIWEVKQIIQKQIDNYEVWFSSIPTVWYQYYDTSDEALEYLGCQRVQLPDLGWKETRSRLEVQANEAVEFTRIRVDVYYEYNGCRLQAVAEVYTDLDGKQSISISARDLYRDTYTQDTYVTADGRTAVIICAMEDEEFSYADGYVVVGNILYRLHVIEDDQDQALRLLRQWLDAF